MRFGIVPPEPLVDASLTGLAPSFASRVGQVLNTMKARGRDATIREALRTAERQAWLWGFGRSYDDGRGIVTNAATGRTSWHFYGLAVDIVSDTQGDDARPEFWRDLFECYHMYGLVSGLDWTRSVPHSLGDRPHGQWGYGMRYSPSPHAYALYLAGGRQAVWKAVGATGDRQAVWKAVGAA